LKYPSLNPLSALVLRALVLMPLSLAFWWFFARIYCLKLLEWLVSGITLALLADKVVGIESNDLAWLLKTSLSTVDTPLETVGIPIATNRFTVGFGLLWGLILATPGIHHWRQLFWGTLALIPVATLMALMLVQFQLALYINHQPILTEVPRGDFLLALPYPDHLYYLMAVGRQLSVLVLPTLAPLTIWSLLNRRFVQGVILESVLSQSVRQHSSSN